jgi:hypothetical protein
MGRAPIPVSDWLRNKKAAICLLPTVFHVPLLYFLTEQATDLKYFTLLLFYNK